MKKINVKDSIYEVKTTSKFNKGLKKVAKQGKDINKIIEVIEMLANGEELDPKYKNHKLIDDKNYKNCCECHIRLDWLLIYQYNDNELLLLYEYRKS